VQGLEVFSNIASRLPTETRRSERQMQLQQFSTSLEWGWVAAMAAQVRGDDVVLEPSAGTGCLAEIGQMSAKAGNARARDVHLFVNELDPVRSALLGAKQGREVSTFDAEFIDDLLDGSINPSVVMMNPPFASSVSRSGDSTIALRHVLSAAKRLSVGGRLVAIVAAGSLKGAWWGTVGASVRRGNTYCSLDPATVCICAYGDNRGNSPADC
jgi:predicted RNA methylase